MKLKSLKLVFLKSLNMKFQVSMSYGFKMKNLQRRRLYFSKFQKNQSQRRALKLKSLKLNTYRYIYHNQKKNSS